MTRKEMMEFAAFTQASGRLLYGERVAVIRDEKDEMLGEFVIGADEATSQKYTGTVVCTGLGIDDKHEELAGLKILDCVAFNVYEPMRMNWPNHDGTDVEVLIFHAADIYVGWRPDGVVGE